MANPIFNQFGNQNPFSQLISQVENFKKSFKGNPKEEVQRLLNSGQMSQEQFNQFAQVARQMEQFMGNR